MTESEFLAAAEAALSKIETALEQVSDSTDLDVECSRNGNVLEIEFVGSKIIVNSQAPMQELWIAAKSGGFHYRQHGDTWLNTRDGSEFFAALSVMISQQGGVPVVLQS
ncbi:iron donor protein CyaY [Paraherbaspirillum soli]|uniref:Iron-sulfur cluster assembly protein CyaY n=1 Tax=Paraherbaspirillum soli TaxID=631222 RepID=A0ABW0M4B9_9BURK